MNNIKGFRNTRKINEEAAKWILLIEECDELTKEQEQDLRDWVNTSDIHRECFSQMAKSWGEMNLLGSIMAPAIEKERSSLAILKAWLLTPVIALLFLLAKVFSKSNPLFKPVVAFPVAALCSGWLVFSQLDGYHLFNTDQVYSTAKGEQISHQLEDGSVLWLNSDSSAKVIYSDSHRRIHLLRGEAHFDVSKDRSRPFEVYANGRMVRAIGTAFSVYRLKDRIEVLVSEGTVELAIVDETLVLTPDNYAPLQVALQNDETPTDSQGKHVEADGKLPDTETRSRTLGRLVAGQRVSIPTTSVNDGQPLENVEALDVSEITRKLSWREGKLVFAGESLQEVVTEISRHSSVRIDFVDPELKTMRIGGQFQVGETDNLFYVLESGFGIQVNKVNRNHVQLSIKE